MPRLFLPVQSHTDHGLYQEVRACTACPLRDGCKGPVPPVGHPQARVMLVGEAPGANEDDYGIPFTGAAWEELAYYLQQAGLSRDAVFLSNVVKCRPKSDPKYADADPCAGLWLQAELQLVKPQIVVAMGQLAIQVLLGDYRLSVQETHGIAVRLSLWGHECWVLPTYHPAAGLYRREYMSWLLEDFHALKDLREGVAHTRPVDELEGEEVYENRRALGRVIPVGWVGEFLGVDTETLPDGSLWCTSVSDGPGHGVVITPQVARNLFLAGRTVYHNSLFDLPKLLAAGLLPNPHPVDDTYVMAKMLQKDGLGLKALARRYLGMRMRSYQDVVRPHQARLAKEYVRTALELVGGTVVEPQYSSKTGKRLKKDKVRWAWPESPPEFDYHWDSREGELSEHVKQPQHIAKKLERLVGDLEEGESAEGAVTEEGEQERTDPTGRWRKYTETERRPIEDALGPFPVASLADVPTEEAVFYSARDADATRRLYPLLLAEIQAAGLEEAYNLTMRSIPLLSQMSANGVLVDRDYTAWLARDLRRRQEQELEQCWETVGAVFNPGSGDQVAQVLFHKLKLEARGMTKGGKRETTDDEVLIPLKRAHPVVEHILAWRKYEKLAGSFAEPYLALSAGDGRLRDDYGMTVTGRFTAKRLMTIPKRGDEATEVRNCIVAPPRYTLVELDANQVEMRVLAHESQDAALTKIFLEDGDVHTLTASDMFRIPPEHVDKDKHRLPAKNVGFGIVYGLTYHGLWKQMEQNAPGEWTASQCEDLIQRYAKARPGVVAYQKDMITYAKRYGEVRDMFGWRRLLPEIRSPRREVRAEAERMAINTPVQSGAVNITKIAMGMLWDIWQDGGGEWAWFHRARPILQVHDSLVWEVPDELVGGTIELVRECMETAARLRVPLKAEAAIGKRLGEMTEMKG